MNVNLLIKINLNKIISSDEYDVTIMNVNLLIKFIPSAQ